MDDLDIYEIGTVAWHSSDGDGGGPDVGISVGLGDAMLYAGEVPGAEGPWSLAIYPTDGDRIVIAETVHGEAARDLIDMLGSKLRATLTPASDDRIEALEAENARLREERDEAESWGDSLEAAFAAAAPEAYADFVDPVEETTHDGEWPEIPDTPEQHAYIRGWNDCMKKTHKLVRIDPPLPPEASHD